MSDLILLLLLALVAGLVYFLPTIVAYNRQHPRTGAIFMLNAALGWTFWGWALAGVWAFIDKPAAEINHHIYKE